MHLGPVEACRLALCVTERGIAMGSIVVVAKSICVLAASENASSQFGRVVQTLEQADMRSHTRSLLCTPSEPQVRASTLKPAKNSVPT